MSHTASPTATPSTASATAAAPGAPSSAIDLVADKLLDAELWPEDGEIVAEIRAMFMHNWGMDATQADARMSRFDFKAALASLAAVEGGAA
ncbi:hypothetical protein SAMN05880566_102207 [Janthinobacterium sp. TND4EL3]|jgi:hypothetical protein|uniref:hypothetical protein n=1 Tax=Janthinobacterium sp. TND4EL3 TaxID=1907311 RepID=UPI0009564C03|nr:hypothetical protein [Janthinobacterium sp. TND4EL3]SIQ21354.1 hypothetical protein SAMN05880566_102207 [Janthinobacterium sp. TND4EL3]